MPRPTIITVKGQFLRVDGTPEVGTVEFHSRVYTLYSHASSAIVPSRISAALDYLGNLEIELPATNDPAWSPVGWKYTMIIKFGGDYSIYEVSVPHDAPGHELSLGELIPVGPSQPIDPVNYAPLVHNHTAADIVSGTIAMARLPVGLTHSTVAYGDHTHPGMGGDIEIDDVAGLTAALNGKASAVHQHTIADVTNLTSELAARALLVHTHSIANVNSLQTVLDSKASVSSVSSVADRVTAVEAMTPVVLVWNGTAYVESDSARIYVGPNDPGAVVDGSVWIDTTP